MSDASLSGAGEAQAAKPMALDAQPFDICGELPRGVTVLEASAGTGKTFTIAALAARYVAEGTPLDQLLLVTFTRAATSELRERVRQRLVETEVELARVVAGAPPTQLDEVITLLASAPPDVVALRRERLAHAIANFDAATIETTHGFCQKVLDTLGTLADIEPDVTFVESVDDLMHEVIDDLFVRRFFRDRDGLRMSRTEADAIARIAIENPIAPIHPREPEQGTAPAMRRGLADRARSELEARKRRQALMTHDDQLTRLRDTLRGPNGPAAIASLRRRYGVVMIDEFQDTDPIQWEIVRRAFATEPTENTTLVLIGDPKQAIYAFRGADVYAYLDAAASAGTRATLDVNRRSDQPLLDGLDALFGHARLGHPGIVYRRVQAAPGHRVPRLRGAPTDASLRVRLLPLDEPAVMRTPSGFPNAESTRAFIARDLAADVVRLLSSGAEIERRDDEGTALSRAPIAPAQVAVLVRTHRNARLVQDELEGLGVPAVISGSGSVFGTPAGRDWLTMLESLEQPSHPSRARSAALTPLIGMTAAELAIATESELEALHRRLHAWARTLRELGVSALADSILTDGRAPERLLSQTGGERRLTDLQHVGQLLNAAADAEQFGLAALTGWLRQRISAADREGSNDERTRRLDSDADAVQVLTFHRSKGLEFPVVYCPLLWEPGFMTREGSPVYFHDDDGERAIDIGLSGDGYKAHYLRHSIESRGEDLRLAYVALTRARHQAVIWWASSWSANESPLGRLLFAQRPDGEVDWRGGRKPREADAEQRFEEIRELAPHAVAVESATLGLPLSWRPELDADAVLERARFTRRLDSSWRRTSYTALTAAAHDALVTSEPERAGVLDEPEGPPAAELSGELPLSTMASGPRLGTLIHETLQLAEFDAPDLPAALTAQLGQAVAHRPELLGCPPELAAAGLACALATPLGGELGSLALTGLSRQNRLDELEFELPLAGGEDAVEAARLDDLGALLGSLTRDGDPTAGYAQRLTDPSVAAVLRGYLTGSIDLVLRVPGAAARGRYAIIDYKTNWLAPSGEPLTAAHYHHSALAAEMQRSHYVLQGLLYSVALHRYLRWRLPAYDPDTDLAGIHYLFLRGMTGPQEPRGVFSWRPGGELISALSDLLAGVT